MRNQRHYALQALAAVVHELDDKLTDLSRDQIAEQHNHLVWLTTAASLLADLAVEQAANESASSRDIRFAETGGGRA